MPPTQRKLAAILSADVVGYSRLMAEDEDTTVRTLSDYREEIGLLVKQHRGRVVDSPGDNLLAEFPTATDAVQCAVEIQGSLAVRNQAVPADRKMEFRLGVHLGEVRVEGERIYGDGVNVAARLEGLAEPGGVCLSEAVHAQVERKLALDYEDLGERALKNIPRPVRAYRVAGPRESEGTSPGANDLTVPGFGGRPTIAVLPFDNLSADPDQEYFADGIVEDLITRLSTLGVFPVIARNSTFTYRGRSVDVKQVSRELGARYVVEGSVRRSGSRVRITAQLIDATSGHHLWAERYDRELCDVFALQDEITEALVASIEPQLRLSERERVARAAPRDLDAWDLFNRGGWHLAQLTRDDNAAARELFRRATQLDRSLPYALAYLAYTHFMDLMYMWTDSHDGSLAEFRRTALDAVEGGPRDYFAYAVLGLAHVMSGEPGRSIAAYERAISLNPSSTRAHALLGAALAVYGRPEEGIAHLEKALRLSPRDPEIAVTLHSMALAQFAAERYASASEWASRAIEEFSRNPFSHLVRAASLAHLERLDEARGALDQARAIRPDLSQAYLGITFPAASDFLSRLLDGLRRAGLPEE
jgi:adenylate cyclase